MQFRIQRHYENSERAQQFGGATGELSDEQQHQRRRLATATPAPIRITPIYQLPSTLSASTVATIQAVLTGTIQTLSSYLQVRVPVDSNGLLVPPSYTNQATCTQIKNNPAASNGATCSAPGWYPTFGTNLPLSDVNYPSCGNATIDPAHILDLSCINNNTGAPKAGCYTSAAGTTGGAQTDLYLYVTQDDSSCLTNVAAYALPCLYDYTSNRPLLSVVNICSISLTSYTVDKFTATVVHEATHSLGFTAAMFLLFINPNSTTVPQAPLGQAAVVTTVSSAVSPNRNNYNLLISPTVLREVRLQFNCSTLAGAALEDQGGAGSAGSHWEFELFEGELMTPTRPADASDQRYSRLTLALLEDSGWYLGNWTQSSYLDWGRNAGCAFPQQTCTSYMANFPSQIYYCSNTNSLVDTCTFSGISSGYCAINTFAVCGIVSSLAAGPTSVVVAPGCQNSAYTNAGAAYDAAGIAAFGWAIDASARCLTTSLPLSATVPAPSGISLASGNGATLTGICWNAACAADGVSMTFTIAGKATACPAGTSIPLSSISSTITNGTITCPTSTVQACRTLNCPAAGCANPGGSCFEGQCVCRLGNYGPTCSSDRVAAALASSGGVITSPPPPPSPPPPGGSTTVPGLPGSNTGTGLGNLSNGLAGALGGLNDATATTAAIAGTTLLIIIIVCSSVGGLIVLVVLIVVIMALRKPPSQVQPAPPPPTDPAAPAAAAMVPSPAPPQMYAAYSPPQMYAVQPTQMYYTQPPIYYQPK